MEKEVSGVDDIGSGKEYDAIPIRVGLRKVDDAQFLAIEVNRQPLSKVISGSAASPFLIKKGPEPYSRAYS